MPFYSTLTHEKALGRVDKPIMDIILKDSWTLVNPDYPTVTDIGWGEFFGEANADNVIMVWQQPTEVKVMDVAQQLFYLTNRVQITCSVRDADEPVYPPALTAMVQEVRNLLSDGVLKLRPSPYGVYSVTYNGEQYVLNQIAENICICQVFCLVIQSVYHDV